MEINFNQENSDPEEQDAALTKKAVPLCLNCLEPCDPLANYCPHCGSNEAINPLASYMPFVDIRFKVGMIGKLWRKAWSPGTSIGRSVFYGCLILLFAPLFIVVALPIAIYERLKTPPAPDSDQEIHDCEKDIE